METMTLTRGPLVRMSIVRDVVYFATSKGAPLPLLLAEAGLEANDLNDVNRMLSREQVHQLWEAAVKLSNRPSLGLEMGSTTTPAILGVAGHLYQSCPHLLEAMRCVERFNDLFGNSVRVELLEEAERVGLRFYQPGLLLHESMGARQSLDAWMSATRYIFERMGATAPQPIQVLTSCPNAERRADYQKHFGSTQLEMDAPDNAIWYHRHEMEAPLITSDPELYRHFLQLANEMLEQMHGADLTVSKVRKLLISTFETGFAGIEDIADALHLTPRTLQRRLQAQGYTFSQILEEMKQEMSARLLRSRKYSISEVAFMLGFSEPGSFSRSFRKWTGLTPRSFMN